MHPRSRYIFSHTFRVLRENEFVLTFNLLCSFASVNLHPLILLHALIILKKTFFRIYIFIFTLKNTVHRLWSSDTEINKLMTSAGHDNLETTEMGVVEDVDIKLTYNVSMDFINMVTSQSLVCHQYVKWQCRSAPISNPDDSASPYVYWRNKDNENRFNWGGVEVRHFISS